MIATQEHKEVKNYARFFALFNRMQGADEELKEELVGSFTGGRTTSLREMATWEYNQMCNSMQGAVSGKSDYSTKLKAARSAFLLRLQRIGIDTTDWARVDNYCLNPRIAGKVFRRLTIEELQHLIPKLASIEQKKKEKSQTVEYLQQKLEQAVANEEYEMAAEIRDKINSINSLKIKKI